MTRLLLFSDIHLDHVTAGLPRLPDCVGFLDRVADACEEHEVDVACFLGDAFDPGTRYDCRNAALLIRHAYEIHRRCARGSIWIAGNHDVVEAADGGTTLDPLAAFAELSDPPIGESMVVATEPRQVWGLGTVAFVLLPFVARANYRDDMLDEALYPTARLLGGSVVVLAHWSVAGAMLGSESKELARGRDMELPLDRIAKLSPKLVANGHYHRPQVVRGGAVDVVIPGSPVRFTYSEAADHAKGYVVVDV